MNTGSSLLAGGQFAPDHDPTKSYRQLKSAIAKEAMWARVEAGECPGRAPVGYHNVVVGNRRTVKVDPVLGPLIAEAFRMATQRKSSLRKILAELTPRGIVGKEGRPMGVSALQVVLNNPFYAGWIRLNDKLVRGSHQALISKSLFERVHRRLDGRRCR